MKEKRPLNDIETTSFDKLLDRISFLFLFIQFLIVGLFYASLGDTVPIRFDGAGEVSATGSRAAIFLVPVVSALLYVMFLYMYKKPHTYNYPIRITPENAAFHYKKAVRAMRYTNLIVMMMMAYITWSMASVGSGASSRINTSLMAIFTLLLFVPVGHHLFVMWKRSPQ